MLGKDHCLASSKIGLIDYLLDQFLLEATDLVVIDVYEAGH